MKLSDPFGRLESRNQKGYEAMRDRLQIAGIVTPKAALKVVEDSKRRAKKFLIIGIAVLLLMAAAFPQTLPVAFGLAVFLSVFVFNSTSSGEKYIKRYIEEDLKSSQEDKN